MNELVFLKSNQPVTTSLIIAEGTGNEHESIMRNAINLSDAVIKAHRINITAISLKESITS